MRLDEPPQIRNVGRAIELARPALFQPRDRLRIHLDPPLPRCIGIDIFLLSRRVNREDHGPQEQKLK